MKIEAGTGIDRHLVAKQPETIATRLFEDRSSRVFRFDRANSPPGSGTLADGNCNAIHQDLSAASLAAQPASARVNAYTWIACAYSGAMCRLPIGNAVNVQLPRTHFAP